MLWAKSQVYTWSQCIDRVACKIWSQCVEGVACNVGAALSWPRSSSGQSTALRGLVNAVQSCSAAFDMHAPL